MGLWATSAAPGWSCEVSGTLGHFLAGSVSPRNAAACYGHMCSGLRPAWSGHVRLQIAGVGGLCPGGFAGGHALDRAHIFYYDECRN